MFLDPGLAALAAVLRHGSFDAAARALHLTQSAISQRIRTLEDRMGTPLVLRGTPCRPTHAGERLFRHAEELARLDAALEADIGITDPHTRPVRIAANADSLATWLLPAFAATDRFLYELIVDDQDHSVERLRRGDVAAAVTADGRPVHGADTLPLGALRYVATASPDFVRRWFRHGPTPEALARAPALVFDEKDRLQTDWAARIAGRPVLLPRHRLPSTHAFVEAGCLGLGWGLNPEPLIRDHLADGRLVPLAVDAPYDTPLFWQVSRIGGAVLAPITRAVRRAARATLVQPED